MRHKLILVSNEDQRLDCKTGDNAPRTQPPVWEILNIFIFLVRASPRSANYRLHWSWYQGYTQSFRHRLHDNSQCLLHRQVAGQQTGGEWSRQGRQQDGQAGGEADSPELGHTEDSLAAGCRDQESSSHVSAHLSITICWYKLVISYQYLFHRID